MKLLKLIRAYRQKWFAPSLHVTQQSILGRQLSLCTGTVPGKADKDDAWFYALAKHHHHIFDIGCNVGYSAILACLQDAGKTMVLADPNAMALQYAKGNLERNGMAKNKTFVCAFVGEAPGADVRFYTLGAGAAGSYYGSHAESAKAVNAHTTVRTSSIDSIVAETGITPDLVKIDVEAAEAMALRGATVLAGKQRTKFLVEMHGPAEMPMEKNAALVLQWCDEVHYVAYYMTRHTLMQTPNTIADRGRCHLLLLPKGVAYPDYLKSIRENDPLPQGA